ncbi:hypothetical protein C8R45DRAFT_1204401 [Mycena sanguinolenta]|nr:hypothetical protein C8R45DRAFT_1204401 [Mycena sanguinolenta]
MMILSAIPERNVRPALTRVDAIPTARADWPARDAYVAAAGAGTDRTASHEVHRARLIDAFCSYVVCLPPVSSPPGAFCSSHSSCGTPVSEKFSPSLSSAVKLNLSIRARMIWTHNRTASHPTPAQRLDYHHHSTTTTVRQHTSQYGSTPPVRQHNTVRHASIQHGTPRYSILHTARPEKHSKLRSRRLHQARGGGGGGGGGN